jgi:peptidoglycan/LPS O-acetylase OafA/YrhL
LQFYILIGLLFPLMKKSFSLLAAVFLLMLILSCFTIPNGLILITSYLSFFALGISVYFFKILKRVPLTYFLLITLIFLAQIYVFLGTSTLLVSIFTLIILFTWSYINRLTRFFSRISYSLFLVHVPVGGKVINLGLRYVNTDLERYLLVIIALAIAFGCSYLFYLLVEKPFLNLSKKIVYKKLSPGVSIYSKPI